MYIYILKSLWGWHIIRIAVRDKKRWTRRRASPETSMRGKWGIFKHFFYILTRAIITLSLICSMFIMKIYSRLEFNASKNKKYYTYIRYMCELPLPPSIAEWKWNKSNIHHHSALFEPNNYPQKNSVASPRSFSFIHCYKNYDARIILGESMWKNLFECKHMYFPNFQLKKILKITSVLSI